MRRCGKAMWFCVILVICGGFAAGCLAAIPFPVVRAWVDQYAGDGSAEPYTPALHGRLRISLAAASLVCVILAIIMFRCRNADDGLARLRNDARDLRLRRRALTAHLGIGLVSVTVLSAALRMPYLDQPMRFDESYTWINYAGRPAVILVATYEEPNNHVLHSLLVHGVTRLLGEESWAIRLPAFLAGILVAPATMLLARAAAGRTAAWFAGLLTAASSPLIEYSTNARGYTLLILLTVLCWLLARLLVRRQNRLGWWLLGGGLALGAWTIPVMLYPAVMVLVWIAQSGLRTNPSRRREILRGLLAAFVVGGGLALILYAPILLVSGPGSLIAGRNVEPGAWSQYASEFAKSASNARRLLLRDIAALPALLLAIGFLYGVVSRRGALAPAVATVLLCLLLTVIQRVLPPARVWLFLIPLAAVVVGTGYSQMANSLTGRARHVAMASLVLLTIVWPAADCLRSGSILRSEETGVCPDARRIVELLRPTLEPHQPIISATPVSAPIIYYADRAGLSREHFAPLDTYPEPVGPAVAVVSTVQEQSLEEVLVALNAPPELHPESFEPVARFPSAIVYRRMPVGGK